DAPGVAGDQVAPAGVGGLLGGEGVNSNVGVGADDVRLRAVGHEDPVGVSDGVGSRVGWVRGDEAADVGADEVALDVVVALALQPDPDPGVGAVAGDVQAAHRAARGRAGPRAQGQHGGVGRQQAAVQLDPQDGVVPIGQGVGTGGQGGAGGLGIAVDGHDV